MSKCARDTKSTQSRTSPARVLVADPPWSFGDKLPGPGRGAEKHYSVLTQAEIECFTLPRLADDALLFLWRVASQVEEAYRVCRAWGFTPKSEIIWRKVTTHGKRHFGMGRYVRAEHETAIVATRGRFTVADRSIRSTFDAPVGRHSEKPDAFYEIAERLGGEGPFAELFARRIRKGWLQFGDELPEVISR